MSGSTVTYRKLPGRGPALLNFSRLWLAEDHLMEVTNAFGYETYRRFYLRDIQAVVARRTSGRMMWNAILGGCALLSALALGTLMYVIWKSGSGGITPAFWAGAGVGSTLPLFLLLCLMVNTLRGPACAVFIQTAAGQQRVGAPVRIRRLRKLLQELTPAVERQQSLEGRILPREPVSPATL